MHILTGENFHLKCVTIIALKPCANEYARFGVLVGVTVNLHSTRLHKRRRQQSICKPCNIAEPGDLLPPYIGQM
jgi:hypothetical protein